jgi:hypothetical protein
MVTVWDGLLDSVSFDDVFFPPQDVKEITTNSDKKIAINFFICIPLKK